MKTPGGLAHGGGCPAEEVNGRDGLAFVDPEDRRVAEEAARGCWEKPGAVQEASFLWSPVAEFLGATR